jgi:hypothetical protein
MNMSVANPTAGFSLDASVPETQNPTASLLMALACLLLFLLLNPFLALFILALASFTWRMPKYIFLIMASLSFALFFNSREFGVWWYPDISGDDVPNYVWTYEANYGRSFQELVHTFLAVPNGNEILWHAPWWALMQIFDASDETFVFVHYVVVFLSVFVAMRLLSKRYWIVFAVVYFFLTPLAVDSVAHVWRQQLAFAMFVSGIGLCYSRGNRAGGWLMHLAFFLHVSVIFFIFAYWTFLLIRRFDGFRRRGRFALLIVILMTSVPVLSAIAVRVLDSLGMARIMAFFEGYGTDVVRVYLLLLVYAIPMLGAYFLLRNDDLNHLILVLCFAVFSLVLALPGANGVYDRLLMFALPLMGFYFFRVLQVNFAARWQMPVLCLIFAIGAYRMYLPTREGYGVMSFLAFGHGLDPTMGALRLLAGF